MPREKTDYWTRHSVKQGKPYVLFHYHGETHRIPAAEARLLAGEMWNDANRAEELAAGGIENDGSQED